MTTRQFSDAVLLRLGLPSRDRRALGVGAAIIATVFVLGRGVPAWHQWEQSAVLEASNSRRRLALAHEVLSARTRTVEAERVAASEMTSLVDTYFEAPSVTEAGAALAGFVDELGEENAVRVSSAQLRSDTVTRATFTKVAVRIAATSDVQGLAEFLSSLEGAQKLLAIRDLTVAQSDPSAPESRPEALHFEMLVEGIARVPERSRAPIAAAMTNAPRPTVTPAK